MAVFITLIPLSNDEPESPKMVKKKRRRKSKNVIVNRGRDEKSDSEMKQIRTDVKSSSKSNKRKEVNSERYLPDSIESHSSISNRTDIQMSDDITPKSNQSISNNPIMPSIKVINSSSSVKRSIHTVVPHNNKPFAHIALDKSVTSQTVEQETVDNSSTSYNVQHESSDETLTEDGTEDTTSEDNEVENIEQQDEHTHTGTIPESNVESNGDTNDVR